MRRRAVILGVGSGALAPLTYTQSAQSQQTRPTIGFLHSQSADGYTHRLRAFHAGLKETGFVEGENVTVLYRWAESQLDLLPALAAELVRHKVSVIVTAGGPLPALAAKTATTAIPIVFSVPDDPVRLGLVASLARPGGNLTGINFLTSELVAKRLELLREMVPEAVRVAVLVNPAHAPNAEPTLRAMETAAPVMGLQIHVLNASSSGEIDSGLAGFARGGPGVLFVGGDPFLNSRRVQLATLTARLGIPAAFSLRDYPEVGGLMSYGANLSDANRQVGVYAGRILKGATAADLPVVQASKFELVINHQTARILGLKVPPALLARADEVIE